MQRAALSVPVLVLVLVPGFSGMGTTEPAHPRPRPMLRLVLMLVLVVMLVLMLVVMLIVTAWQWW